MDDAESHGRLLVVDQADGDGLFTACSASCARAEKRRSPFTVDVFVNGQAAGRHSFTAAR
jgi:hypothetical protein